jgi:hypothetical protein
MQVAEMLEHFWEILANNLGAFVVVGTVIALVAVAVTRLIDNAALNAARERLAASQDEVRRLKEEREAFGGSRSRNAERDEDKEIPQGKLQQESPSSGAALTAAGGGATSSAPEPPPRSDETTKEGDPIWETSLSGDEDGALKYLADSRLVSSADLSFFLDLHPQKARHIIEGLEAHSMIKFHSSDSHGRKRYELAAEGRRLLEEWNLLD